MKLQKHNDHEISINHMLYSIIKNKEHMLILEEAACFSMSSIMWYIKHKVFLPGGMTLSTFKDIVKDYKEAAISSGRSVEDVEKDFESLKDIKVFVSAKDYEYEGGTYYESIL